MEMAVVIMPLLHQHRPAREPVLPIEWLGGAFGEDLVRPEAQFQGLEKVSRDDSGERPL